MEKKVFILRFYKEDGTLLECRLCSHLSAWQADWEAKLYAAWAAYHYQCKVTFRVSDS